MLGEVPAPELVAGGYLVQILFAIGPSKADGPIDEAAIEVYERRRGLALEPWQADAIVAMSRGYISEAHAAQKYDAVSPWPEAEKMWHHVRNVHAERTWDRLEKG